MHVILKDNKRVGSIDLLNGSLVLRSRDRKAKKAFREVVDAGGFVIFGAQKTRVKGGTVDGSTLVKPTVDNLWQFERYLPEGYTVEESEPV